MTFLGTGSLFPCHCGPERLGNPTGYGCVMRPGAARQVFLSADEGSNVVGYWWNHQGGRLPRRRLTHKHCATDGQIAAAAAAASQ